MQLLAVTPAKSLQIQGFRAYKWATATATATGPGPGLRPPIAATGPVFMLFSLGNLLSREHQRSVPGAVSDSRGWLEGRTG